MIVLAFDPGLKSIGYALVQRSHKERVLPTDILDIGVIKSKPGEKNRKEMAVLLRNYPPIDYVGFEWSGIFLNSQYKLIIEEACRKYQIPVLGCSVQNVRAKLYNNPSASKQETINILKEKIMFFRENISKHELDALSIALFVLDIDLV